jgi:hypothetical protein
VQEQKMMIFPSVARSRERKKIIPNTKKTTAISCCPFFGFCFGQGDKLQIYLQMVVTHSVPNFSTNPSRKWEESTQH